MQEKVLLKKIAGLKLARAQPEMLLPSALPISLTILKKSKKSAFEVNCVSASSFYKAYLLRYSDKIKN